MWLIWILELAETWYDVNDFKVFDFGMKDWGINPSPALPTRCYRGKKDEGIGFEIQSLNSDLPDVTSWCWEIHCFAKRSCPSLLSRSLRCQAHLRQLLPKADSVKAWHLTTDDKGNKTFWPVETVMYATCTYRYLFQYVLLLLCFTPYICNFSQRFLQDQWKFYYVWIQFHKNAFTWNVAYHFVVYKKKAIQFAVVPPKTEHIWSFSAQDDCTDDIPYADISLARSRSWIWVSLLLKKRKRLFA